MSEEKQEGAAAPAETPKRGPGRPRKVQPAPAAAPAQAGEQDLEPSQASATKEPAKEPEAGQPGEDLSHGALGVSEDEAVGPIEPAAAPALSVFAPRAAAPAAPAAKPIRVRAGRSLGFRTSFLLSPEVEREISDPEAIAWIRKNHPEIILEG